MIPIGLSITGIACAAYGTQEEQVVNRALVSVFGITEDDDVAIGALFSVHVCIDSSRRRNLLTADTISISTTVTIVGDSSDGALVTSTISNALGAATSSGELISAIVEAAAAAGIETMISISQASTEAVWRAAPTPVPSAALIPVSSAAPTSSPTAVPSSPPVRLASADGDGAMAIVIVVVIVLLLIGSAAVGLYKRTRSQHKYTEKVVPSEAKEPENSNRASSALVAVTAAAGGAVVLGGGTAEDFALGATEAFRMVLDVGEHIPLVGGCFKIIKTFANLTIDALEMDKTVKTMHVALHGYTVALEKAARVGTDAAVDDATVKLVAMAEEQLRALVQLTGQHQGSGAIVKALKTTTFKQLWRNSLAAIDALVNALQVGLAADVLAVTQKAATQAREANAGVLSALDVVMEKIDTVIEGQGAIADDVNALKQELKRKTLKEKARERTNETIEHLELVLDQVEAEPFATGGFGAVFRGELAGDVVAVKKTTLGQMSRLEREKVLRDVSKEVAILNSMRHPRIVLVYGMITADPASVSIVLEFCPGGSLREHLDARFAESGTGCGGAPEITRWLADAAAGMAYLYNKDVEHRDLKSASES